jgi:acyl-CoA thioesterase-2
VTSGAIPALHPPSDELPPPGVDLLDVMNLEEIDRNLYRSRVVFDEIWPLYGGQVAAQALLAAARTVPDGRYAHSIYGYFLRPGHSSRPVVLRVERDRDGGTYSARRVVALQDGEVILNLSASFQQAQGGDDLDFRTMPASIPAPDFLPSSPPGRLIGFEQRLPPQPSMVGGFPTRAWMRCTAELTDDRSLHTALLTYLSDMYTGLGGHPLTPERQQTTLSHAMWFHRPVRVDEWVLMDLLPQVAAGGRAAYTGTIWDASGRLVASLTQETLFRPRRWKRGATG